MECMAKESAGKDAADNPAPKKLGRRPGNEETREAILEAACDSFARVGYESTTIRAVARAADVDPALVIHYFKSKAGLFDAAVETLLTVPADIDHSADLRDMLLTYFRNWEDPYTGPRLRAIVRAGIGSEFAAERLRDYFSANFLDTIKQTPGLQERFSPKQIALFPVMGSMLLGVAITRYLMEYSETAEASTEELVDYLLPMAEALLRQAPDAPA